MIPKRPPITRMGGGSQKAVVDFEAQIFQIALILLEEYRKHYGVSESADPSEVASCLASHNADVTQTRRKVLYELNTSGTYYTFKEQLKRAVVKVC